MPQKRGKKLSESKLRRAMGLKVKLALLEMSQVRAYITADLDRATREETVATLRAAATKLMSAADWMEATGRGANRQEEGHHGLLVPRGPSRHREEPIDLTSNDSEDDTEDDTEDDIDEEDDNKVKERAR